MGPRESDNASTLLLCLGPSSLQHEARCQPEKIMKKEKTTNANMKRGGRTRKKWWFAFRFFFFWFIVMIPHPCLNTLSPLPSFTRIPFSYLPHQYLDSDSALTPSLGRRVGTEYLDPEREAATMLLRYRQCRVSWAFLLLVFALYTYTCTLAEKQREGEGSHVGLLIYR